MKHEYRLKFLSFFPAKFFYLLLSNAEHQQEDWVGIHNRICHLLVPIRNMTSNSLVETQKKMVRVKLISLEHLPRQMGICAV